MLGNIPVYIAIIEDQPTSTKVLTSWVKNIIAISLHGSHYCHGYLSTYKYKHGGQRPEIGVGEISLGWEELEQYTNTPLNVQVE